MPLTALVSVVVPSENVCVLLGESASPQFKTSANVSSVPGSLIVPVTVATAFSLMVGTVFNVTTGATLRTLTEVLPWPEPRFSSESFSEIGYFPFGCRRLSWRY